MKVGTGKGVSYRAALLWTPKDFCANSSLRLDSLELSIEINCLCHRSKRLKGASLDAGQVPALLLNISWYSSIIVIHTSSTSTIIVP